MKHRLFCVPLLVLGCHLLGNEIEDELLRNGWYEVELVIFEQDISNDSSLAASEDLLDAPPRSLPSNTITFPLTETERITRFSGQNDVDLTAGKEAWFYTHSVPSTRPQIQSTSLEDSTNVRNSLDRRYCNDVGVDCSDSRPYPEWLTPSGITLENTLYSTFKNIIFERWIIDYLTSSFNPVEESMELDVTEELRESDPEELHALQVKEFNDALDEFKSGLIQTASNLFTNNLRLASQANRLRQNGIPVVFHARWQQRIRAKRFTRPYFLQGTRYIDGQTPRTEGTIAITKRTFLHADAEFWTYTSTAIGESRPNVMRLKESRRIRLDRTHYLDHPNIGALILISRIPVPDYLEVQLRALTDEST